MAFRESTEREHAHMMDAMRANFDGQEAPPGPSGHPPLKKGAITEHSEAT